ncbi:MAG: bifunctional folylpolyglutamate synthase/dihydrofolate synthase [Proteobacteria bacterium]|nr:bifunctional folylpolyglutamate synthase/dihydrofolate synthase [Pseudomonadota bacterium]
MAARPEVSGAAAGSSLSTAQCEAVLARLIRLHPKLIDLSLGRLQLLLKKLDHPERHLPPVVHVAGTNGKGSTIAYLRAALEASGQRVHVLTSPHLVRFNERIRLGGRLISDEYLVAVLRACEDANGNDPITYFEVTTAAAFLAFRDSPADILLLETGLGGRLDATNVIDKPLLTAITTISLDHQHFLGDTLAEIASEKAGILKPGVTGIIGQQTPDAARAIEAKAAQIGGKLLRQGHDWQVQASDGRLQFQSAMGALNLPLPGLNGVHQLQNAGVALACLQNLEGFSVSAQDMAAGLTTAEWPGRLQRLRRGPLYDQLHDRFGSAGELWLDGGHNPGAGAALAQTLADWQARDDGPMPLHLIVGMLNHKDIANFLAPFRALAPKLQAVAIPHEDATMAPTQIVQAAEAHGLDAAPAENVAQALDRIARTHAAGRAPRVLICGTLYLAGSVLATNPQDEIDEPNNAGHPRGHSIEDI